MNSNIFTNLYQCFIQNSKCISKEHHGMPIYFCSEENCNKYYICSQCLTEDTEHFSQHVKYFIALDTKKNFFNFFDINHLEKSTNEFDINNLRNKKNISFNKKINNSKNFFGCVKEYINSIFIDLAQKQNNMIENFITKEKEKCDKINEFISNKINEFIAKNEKKKINELMQRIKPYINYVNYLKNNNKEKIKLDKINSLINEELKTLIEKCINIYIEPDKENFDLNLNEMKEIKEIENTSTKKDKSFYEGSINNISCINNDNEEIESKININNQNTIKYSSINDSFFKNIEEDSDKNDKEFNVMKNNINKLPFNNYEFQKKQKLSNLNLIYEHDDIYKYIPSKPTITAANNFQYYNSNNDLLNELEIKLNQIHNKDSLRNYLNNKSAINISINNFHKKNNNINNININNIYQSQREKKDINFNIINEGDKLNIKTKNNINRLNKLKEQIDKLIN